MTHQVAPTTTHRLLPMMKTSTLPSNAYSVGVSNASFNSNNNTISQGQAGNSTFRTLKETFTLPLTSSGNSNHTSNGNVHIRGLTPLAQLNSPDLRSLGLVSGSGITPYLNSPDFEKLISTSLAVGNPNHNQNGNVQTPTTFLNPKFVSEEQEQFALHFEEKLKRMIKKEHDENHGEGIEKHQNQMPVIADISYMNMSQPMTLPIVTVEQNLNNSRNYFPSAVAPIHSQNISSHNHGHSLPTASVAPLQMSAMTVSTSQSSYFMSDSGSIESNQGYDDMDTESDIKQDGVRMDQQDGLKLERKRQRNRDAARKCRERKLERIHFLEERVNELKTQNGKLQKTAVDLRDQLKTLQKVILEHTKSGCRVQDAIKAAGIIL